MLDLILLVSNIRRDATKQHQCRRIWEIELCQNISNFVLQLLCLYMVDLLIFYWIDFQLFHYFYLVTTLMFCLKVFFCNL